MGRMSDLDVDVRQAEREGVAYFVTPTFNTNDGSLDSGFGVWDVAGNALVRTVRGDQVYWVSDVACAQFVCDTMNRSFELTGRRL